jgi:uncharacterized protein with NAD-binding domain and iron-sulfur cluster
MMAGKKKVVIIGAGMSGMAAAFGLTSSPNWQDQYDITILQLGWRAGGKGASGRNAAAQQRIEEHGLHVWGGFYENAFRVIRACYTEMSRPPHMPLATWDEAFKPSVLVSWMEDLKNGWLAWNNDFPEYPESTPGDGTPMPSLLDGVLRILEWVIQTALDPGFAGPAPVGVDALSAASSKEAAKPSWIRQMVSDAEMGLDSAVAIAGGEWGKILAGEAHPTEVRFAAQAHTLLKSSSRDPSAKAPSPEAQHAAAWLLNAFREVFRLRIRQIADLDDGLRRAGILIELGVAETIGILTDGVLLHGFNVIDNEDLRAWYTRHGASLESVNSGVVRGVYDFIFAYKKGDPDQPALAAGAGLRCILRLIMWYKGAIFWKMQAGMGDTVFAPLYLVLKARGVQFKFFQKVENLGLSADGTSIATIDVGEQVTLKSGEYEPLYPVKDLPSWPDEPFYDQIVQGEQLKAEGIDLEDPWAPWNPVNRYTLRAGQDFDIVVLATSLAPLAELCRELIAVSPAWTGMMQHVQTVQTQAFQVWMTPALTSLGWAAGSPVLTAFAQPQDTWADMSQVICREVWSPFEVPGSLAYFCGPLIDANPIPPYSDHHFPAQQATLVKKLCLEWTNQNLPVLWPEAGTPGAFRWDLLVDPAGGVGPARFDSQYWRANLSPPERYVLSVPGSTQYRLAADGSGFSNLYLAGDWTLNGLNFGCIESATMGGLEASRAICGYPAEIVGEDDL